MALIIEHRFPLGRFHATRWKQNPFGDPDEEWPPSPWRLLRALAARWFQYVRETGDADEHKRDELLGKLASFLPEFVLPPSTWRGPAIKQYQPTGVEWTDKSKSAAAYKKPQTTLVEDHYRVVPPDEPIYWLWEQFDLTESQTELLDHLLERALYFGRAESFCRLRRVEHLPDGATANSHLTERGTEAATQVLAPIPGHELNIETLLAATDDKAHLKGRPVPPGTTWYYAELPSRPNMRSPTIHGSHYSEGLSCVQFAVGGRVYPPLRRWVKITDRFRGRVIRVLARKIAPGSEGRYDRLTPEQKGRLALICGKDGQGRPLRGHRHAFFLLWPDEHGLPTRLVVWRTNPFTEEEVGALLRASEHSLSWENSTPEWRVRLVPLPFATPTPSGLLNASRVWQSITPFVPPAERRRFRRNGRERPGESTERILAKLLRDAGLPEPLNISVRDEARESTWVSLHETRARRFSKADSRTPWVRPGFNLRVEFTTPVAGPLILGDSCHFGLGLFASS